jgi:uncharacterized protein
MENKSLRIILTTLLVLSLNAAADYPALTGYVNDYAGILSPAEKSSLTDIISEFEKNSSVEIAIVTVPDTGGEDRVLYASRVGDFNRVGKADTDNGVVVLWSLDNEKGGAIATGRGIESVLNDAKVARIGRAGRDLFDSGHYYEGFRTIIFEIEKESSGEYSSESESERIPGQLIGALFIGAIIIGLIIVIWLIGRPIGRQRSKDYWVATSYLGTRSWNAWNPIGGGSGSPGGGFGGGFGGFGGGSFGGGGGKF